MPLRYNQDYNVEGHNIGGSMMPMMGESSISGEGDFIGGNPNAAYSNVALNALGVPPELMAALMGNYTPDPKPGTKKEAKTYTPAPTPVTYGDPTPGTVFTEAALGAKAGEGAARVGETPEPAKPRGKGESYTDPYSDLLRYLTKKVEEEGTEGLGGPELESPGFYQSEFETLVPAQLPPSISPSLMGLRSLRQGIGTRTPPTDSRVLEGLSRAY